MTDTEYYDLIRPYDDAMKLLLTRLEILNHNIYKASAENPIHTMQYRIKSKQSIEEKLIRKGKNRLLKMQRIFCRTSPASALSVISSVILKI